MCYGNTSVSNQENIEGTWDSSFMAVHHMEETSGIVYDSTSKNNDGIPYGAPDQNIAGRIGSANYFDGVNDRIQLPQIYSSEKKFTIEAWVYPQIGARYFVSQWSSYDGVFLQVNRYGNQIQYYINDEYAGIYDISPNKWYYMVCTFDGSTVNLYKNAGTPVSRESNVPDWPSENLVIGDRLAGGRQFHGIVDEVRLSNTARSTGWIKTSYNNQNDPSSFYSVGIEEDSNEDEPPNNPPNAYFTWSPTAPTISHPVQFTDNSVDTDGTIVSWHWNFGDGSISTQKNPVHLYFNEGSYAISLKVTDNDGATDTTVRTVNIATSANEMLDQEQAEYAYDLVAYGDRWGSQSFKPTLDTLTRVELFIGKTGSPDNMIVSVRDNPYGNDLTSVSLPAGNIPTSSDWVSFDFPDVSVNPGSTYYFVIRTGDGDYSQCYKIGFTIGNPYSLGSLWYSGDAASNWIEYAMYDFCFKTYGI